MSRNEPTGSAYPPVPTRGAANDSALVAYDPSFAPGPAEEDIDLRAVWRTIHRYRWTIAGVMGAVLVSTLAATFLMRPVYRASALVEVRPAVTSLVRMNTIEHTFDGRPLEYLITQQRILQSESVATAVIERLGLETDPELSGATRQRGFLSGLFELFAALTGGPADVASHEVDPRLVEAFLDRVEVTLVRDSNLVRVSFDSFTPDRSAEVANAMVEEYVRLNDLRRFESMSGAKEFLAQEISKAEARLAESERGLHEFARRHNIVDVDEGADLVSERVAQLSERLTEAVAERISAEALHRQAQSGDLSSIPAIAANEFVANLQEARAELSSQLVDASQIYKPGYPKVNQLRAQVRDLDASLAAERRRVAREIAVDFEKARGKEQLLVAELERQKEELLDLKDRAVQYHILKRDWGTNRNLYTALLERMKEMGVAGGMEVGNVSVIDRAAVPLERHHPKPLVNAGVAVTVGLTLGLGLAFLLAYLDDVVRTPEDLERLTGLASLGMVPKLGFAEVADDEHLEVMSHTRRQSVIAEALRSVRTNLLVSSVSSGARVIQVTSALEGEGKTTTASNLAVVLAQRGSRVLLVDADLRRPRLAGVFGLDGASGLRDILAGADPRAVARTDIDNLCVLPAGASPPDPTELLASTKMDELIDGIRSSFDYVVIDSAPVLGPADSTVVGTKVDGVVFVVSAEIAKKGAVREAVRRLRLVRAPLVGAVLNMADDSRWSYGYYGYGYGYGYARPEIQQTAAPVAS